ncbi:MAG: hypothetical protein R2722_00850 [Tessaracoccus sp.]
MPTRSAAPAELMAGARKALVWAWGDDGVPAGELTCRAPVRVLRREWRASMGPSPRPEWWSVLVVREVWSSEAGKWREAWGSCLSVEQEPLVSGGAGGVFAAGVGGGGVGADASGGASVRVSSAPAFSVLQEVGFQS